MSGDWPVLAFAAISALIGLGYIRYGTRFFAWQSRAVLGHETTFVKKSTSTRWGRWGVAWIPAVFSLVLALVLFATFIRTT